MQGRCGWIFAFLCANYGKRPEWLEASRSCLDFLEEHCVNHEAGGRLYFTVTGDGKPLRQRRYCHSENFYTMANAEYYAQTGDTVRIERARRAYEMVYKLNHGLIQAHRPGPQDHPRDPPEPGLRRPDDLSERHQHHAPLRPGAQGAL